MINICIPVLNNYNGLLDMIYAFEQGSLVPDHYYVIDNGLKFDPADYTFFKEKKMTVITPDTNVGIATSWNWFLQNVPEMRIISNDDIIIRKDSLKQFIDGLVVDKFCFPEINGGMNSFSFFYIPDVVVKKVGLFDETISPGYGYFEDNDYHHRMVMVDENIHPVPTDMGHVGSTTLKNMTPQEQELHHAKFRRARGNYLRKWGGPPAHEVFEKAYNEY